jgi:hypothetical protein
MNDTSGISTSTFTNRNPSGQRANRAGSGEPGTSADDHVGPDSNPSGYDIPPGFTAYTQAAKREQKRTATAAQTGPAAQSTHTRGRKPAARGSK